MAGNSVGSCGYDEFRPLLETLKSIDSLVIVHPDNDGVDMMDDTFFSNIVFSSEYLQERVFVIPEISRRVVEEIYGSLADSWLILNPDSYYRPEIFKDIYEQVRDYLDSRSQISIHPWSEAVLGFGGKHYEYCVSSLARRV